MQSTVEMAKSFFDDMLRQRWGDLIGLFLILLGVLLIVRGGTELVQDTGKGLISTGLITVRPKSMENKNGNGAPEPGK